MLERIVAGSCRLKAAVVERDEREAELRNVLNYGHTIGHAIEAATGYARCTHGEAVSLGHGRRGAAGASGSASPTAETTARQERCSRGSGCPVHGRPAIDAGRVLDAMARDKKARDGRVPFVLAPRDRRVPRRLRRAAGRGSRRPSRRRDRDRRPRVDNGDERSV